MAGYTKLFSDIVDSSIWAEDPEVCKVWVTLLALSDADGFVRGSAGWLAGKARVSIEHCEAALLKFEGPDLNSRTPDNDGRRIEKLVDGWLILNYLAFRDRLSNDASAISSRERVRKHRERYRALRNVTSVTHALPASASEMCNESAVEEEEVQEEEPPATPVIPPDRWTVEQFVAAAKPAGVSEADARQCFAHYQTQGWVLGNGRPIALGATPANLLARWNAKAAQQGQESSRSPGDDAPAKPPRPRARWQLKEDMAAVRERIGKLSIGSPSGYASPEQWEKWRQTEKGQKVGALKQELAKLQEQFDQATE